MYHRLDDLKQQEDQRCQALMAAILSLRRGGYSFEAEYTQLEKSRKLRQTYAVEAALELKKCFNSAQNYIKMIDSAIDEMETDPDYKPSNWQLGEDSKSIFEDHFAKNRRNLLEYA